ncbi:MAG TPA: nickel pincer cofactor biosynthesis protein LarB [Caldithrix abyssi]|uniref:Nickel pincer cofactor biosynthesis protein LarB n=1 Tax=Caldithrix abyssi TaxID=187145 RepID=A0A7V4U241_CALAY|nr:nickel pincer cofactor biosynthesis protein LarB [Caldithrix abyssi]
MNEKQISDLLALVAEGSMTIEEALKQLKRGPFNNEISELLHPDYHRNLRQGFSEVVFGEGKSSEQILQAAQKLSTKTNTVLFTRLSDTHLNLLKEKYPTGRHNRDGRTFIINPPARKDAASGEPYVAIVSAGSSDYKVVSEASEVCLAMNAAFEVINDVGVAGLHRFLNKIEQIQQASALVVVAGMEGALPSVVGGVASAPVFGVPTSVGYGASFNGLAALLAMLNSCAPGVTVSNIDNGFSAAFAACQVIKQIMKHAEINGRHKKVK